MDEKLKKKSILAGILVVGLGIGLALNSSTKDADSSGNPLDNSSFSSSDSSSGWKEVALEDVSSGEDFTISELEKPVLLETFAVWCNTCTRQQVEVQKLHEDKESNVTSVSLNVDKSERDYTIRNHIDRNGFNWRYAISPIDLTNTLRNKFGNSILVVSNAPMILICEDGSRRLPDGVKPASKLKEEIEKGCNPQESETSSRSGSGAVS